MKNEKLTNAKNLKNDEFYTQYFDIEKEISAYLEYDPNIFKNKTILLPCDDPEWSNFTKYFAQNFTKFGLKKLISTSYANNSKNYKTNYQPTLFETLDPKYNNKLTEKKGKIFTLSDDKTGDGKINIEDLRWDYLKGDGDFRTDEIKKLRDEADIIITNPPFSLFREFLTWINEGKKKFLIIGRLTTITYKEVFPLIKNNKVWLGNNYKVNGGAMFYEIPEDIANKEQIRDIKIGKDGKKIYITRVQGVRWFTNIEHGRLHEKLPLMTMSEIKRFGSKKKFEKYINYDAIEIPLVKYIPRDYKGVMGVPTSLLDKYNFTQFQIVGMPENKDLYSLKTKVFSKKECKDAYLKKFGKKGTYDMNASGVVRRNGLLEKVFQRVLIKNRKPKI
ncbi:hypothetical protein IDG89_04915 [Pelagibacterales bacterium SAG-MED02]|nr:hypothetical protein [Pelagibacterales bacterium SAG-MED02]